MYSPRAKKTCPRAFNFWRLGEFDTLQTANFDYFSAIGLSRMYEELRVYQPKTSRCDEIIFGHDDLLQRFSTRHKDFALAPRLTEACPSEKPIPLLCAVDLY
jgi:hypothetical protein